MNKLPDDFLKIYGEIEQHPVFQHMRAVIEPATKFLPRDLRDFYRDEADAADGHDSLTPALHRRQP